MSPRPLQRATLEKYEMVYNYGTLSTSHLAELQEFMNSLVEEEKTSDQETFREYVAAAHFALPDGFPEAKSIVVFALYTPLMKAAFHLDGSQTDILVPPQYYDLGLPKDAVSRIIAEHVLSSQTNRLERLTQGHLKLLAVRSGLARYGRNNISYVDGMGSFITLAAFVTDEVLPDEWTNLGTMLQCESCTACLDNCPTGAIRADEFVIDAGKCLALYNEISGDFPEWLPSDIHDACIGCMRCQLPCPANHAVIQDAGLLPDITEEESRAILAGDAAAPEIASAAVKLRMDLTDAETLGIVSRNIRALLVPK